MPMRDVSGSETEPVEGPYADLAHLVRQTLGGMASRVAQRQTGISHSTIADMRKGYRPKASTLVQFAQGFRLDANTFLRAAGYPLQRREEPPDERTLVYEPDPDRRMLIEAYEGADPVSRRLLVALAEQIRRLERSTAIGGKIAGADEENAGDADTISSASGTLSGADTQNAA